MVNVPVKPKWCPPGTVIDKRGWVSKTGELLASRKFSKEEISEWRKSVGLQRKSPTKKVETPPPVEETPVINPPKPPTKKKTTRKTRTKRTTKKTA